MGLKKLAEKVVDYNARLEQGKATRIKPGHVRTVLEKLRRKTVQLEAEIAAEQRAEKKDRLKRKLRTARDLVERAEWLLDQID